MRILVVDDEPPARARLRSLIEELHAGEIVGEAGNGEAALRCVATARADVVLLDIRMPGMDGLEVARHLQGLETPPAVIFTTAYESHALAAFETNAIDYLLKPIRKERLAAALERAGTLTRAQVAGLVAARPEAARARTHISATLQGELRLVPVDDVCYFRAEDKYVIACHPEGELLIDDALSSLETEFGERFLRVHRNALIALAHARGLQRHAGGGYGVRMNGRDETVEVSRRMVASVRRVLVGN